MAWTRPTLPDLVTRIESDINTRFFSSTGPLRRSALKILARVWAGAVYLVHLFLSWIFDQAFAHLADGDQLDRHGQETGIFRKPAAYAQGVILVSGTPGTAILQGALWSATTIDDGVATEWEYASTAPATVEAGGTVLVQISAQKPGAGANQGAGTPFALVTPITGITSAAMASSAIADGTDKEADEPFRKRILFRKRNPPQGGAPADYTAWATSVSGVTDAWIFGNYPEANSVSVRIANFQADPPVASSTVVDKVLAYLNDRTRRPVTADVRVQSVAMVDVVISAQIKPYTPAAQASAVAELEALFSASGRADGEPGAPGTTITASQVLAALGNASGVDGAVLTTITQGGSLVMNVALDMNHIARLAGTSFSTLA